MHEGRRLLGERGSPSLPWTTLGCGDSTCPSCSALPSSVLSGGYVLGCAVPTARKLSLVQPVNLASWTRAPHTTPFPPSSMLRLVRDWVFVVRALFVCKLQMLVRTCVMLRVMCAAVCYKRRHDFDAFLKHFGKRQPQELVRHWTRKDYGPCRHIRLAGQSPITANSKLTKISKTWTPTSEGLAGPGAKKKKTCRAAYSLRCSVHSKHHCTSAVRAVLCDPRLCSKPSNRTGHRKQMKKKKIERKIKNNKKKQIKKEGKINKTNSKNAHGSPIPCLQLRVLRCHVLVCAVEPPTAFPLCGHWCTVGVHAGTHQCALRCSSGMASGTKRQLCAVRVLRRRRTRNRQSGTVELVTCGADCHEMSAKQKNKKSEKIKKSKKIKKK